MADDTHTHDDFLDNEEDRDLDAQNEFEDEYDEHGDNDDEFDASGEDEFDAETGVSLAGATVSHTITDEAGTRLDLSDIHGGTLKPTDMADEMRTSFLEYSMSVIVARALPDVRDGLKPVHRRILYAMNEAGITPNKPHKKSAWAVGEVMGKYHPHGDSAIYDSMVRMSQDFSMRLPLIDGHGNFGSIDGDPPAAMRYTEARLTRSAMEMLADLNKNTVDMQPNYDEALTEPVVLPARFPNLLVNGSSGIAVGMATNIPPHNLGEVTDAVCMMIDNPDVTTEELMSVLPGPDFPTGGIIMGTDGIKDAYETGRGSITVRSKVHVEQVKNGRQRLVVTEIPYQVNKGLLQEKIAQAVNEKKIEGISDMRDESNRKGMRIVIDLKQGAIPQVVLNNLYKRTQLQANFGIIDLALVDGVPRTLSLREILRCYIDHQIDVVRRRIEFDLDKALKRVHILEGLLTAVDNIDEIVHIIRSSQDDAEAKKRMHERFDLDDIQGEAILQMRLRRLTGLARQDLVDEISQLREDIAYYEDLLAHEEKILAVIADELRDISNRFSNKRRTAISAQGVQNLDVEDLIAEEDMVVTVTHAGYVKRLPVATYRSQKRGGKGVQGLSLKDNDFVEDLFVASTHDYVMFFTNFGKVYRLKVHELPIGSRTARGSAIVNVLPLAEGEKVAAVITTRDFPADNYLMFATKQGMVKKTAMSEYDRTRRDGIIAINLKQGDELVNVRRVHPGDKVILCSSDGKAILFDESQARAMGRGTSGVRGITLKGEATMLGMEITNGNGDLFVITEKGYGKRTAVSEYPEHKRGGQGVFTISMTAKKGKLVACRVVGPQHEIMIMSEEGVVIRVKAVDISKLGRSTQGVKVMNIGVDDHVSAIARMIVHKKKAPKHGAGQGMLDLAAAGAKDADETETIDLGDGEDEFDDALIDEDEE
ncbi:DNA gyrase subunit A [Atopobium sp. oral taxon 199]|uniref:DNA gyrase subunit A n=1 Tax=Atopobium sp. oral taxon 199 TaxID=712156 RepID=UPI00034E4AC0|nr:DNA gyrase subunit A [Atopobium sp. oral taxon 199]EPD78732.1 DNA gyrase, A subunit [Atopobium sp. oral taxon 199 str. F0494]